MYVVRLIYKARNYFDSLNFTLKFQPFICYYLHKTYTFADDSNRTDNVFTWINHHILIYILSLRNYAYNSVFFSSLHFCLNMKHYNYYDLSLTTNILRQERTTTEKKNSWIFFHPHYVLRINVNTHHSLDAHIAFKWSPKLLVCTYVKEKKKKQLKRSTTAL